MPDETVWRTMLFDFYGELLTEKQRELDLTHGLLDVGLREPALAAQAFERLGQLVRQGFKCHGIYPFRS